MRQFCSKPQPPLRPPGSFSYVLRVETGYTIGQLATAAGVPTTTVRYCERKKLLRPLERVGSGSYRIYGEEELKRLRFVRAAQAAGFSLEDIAMLLELRDGITEPCKEVQTLIEERLANVRVRLANLRRVERVLKASLKICREQEQSGRCEVIDKLTAATTPPKPRRG